jgi:hypothetical protein
MIKKSRKKNPKYRQKAIRGENLNKANAKITQKRTINLLNSIIFQYDIQEKKLIELHYKVM